MSHIRQIFIISKPSSRVYFNLKNIKYTLVNNSISNNSILFCSTSKGLLTDIECNILSIGGEPVLYVA